MPHLVQASFIWMVPPHLAHIMRDSSKHIEFDVQVDIIVWFHVDGHGNFLLKKMFFGVNMLHIRMYLRFSRNCIIHPPAAHDPPRLKLIHRGHGASRHARGQCPPGGDFICPRIIPGPVGVFGFNQLLSVNWHD